MRHLHRLALLLPSLVLLAGCGEGFPDAEMHLGLEDKVRPYAILVEPPEAAPGDTVRVTLLARAPRPDDLDVTWQVALDFDRGLYGVDEIERNLRALAVPPPSFDADGFLVQSFGWVVPDSALLYSSAIPDVPDDPALAALAERLPGLDTGAPLRKDEIDAWLKGLDISRLLAMDPATRAAAWGLADRFACAVRFRATLRTDVVVDVTRNLTIRQTGRLGGPNTNHNTAVGRLEVVAVQKPDADTADIGVPTIPHTVYRLIAPIGERVADLLEIPFHADWTYFVRADCVGESYTSPWDPGLVLDELGSYRWYYYRQDAPAAPEALFVNGNGDDAEQWELDDTCRIRPAGVGARYRLVLVARDERREWISFHAAPGSAAAGGVVAFVTP